MTGFLAVALLPLGLLAIGVRREMQTRVIAQSEQRADDLAAEVVNEIEQLHAATGAAVSRVAAALPDDARFRAGVLRPDATERGYVLDYAASAMAAAGLSMLQIRNDSGRIVSSGHFPAEFDRLDPHLPRALVRIPGPGLVTVRTAADSLTVLARLDSVMIAGRTFTVVGGRTIDQRFMDGVVRSDEIHVALTVPGGRALLSRPAGVARSDRGSGGPVPVGDSAFERDVIRSVDLSWIDARTTPTESRPGRLAVLRAPNAGDALRRSIDRWIIAAFLLATAGAVLVALWVAARLSRPMEQLADAAATVDIDRLDARFAVARDDEIGVLSRRLTSMIERLRASATRLREAERRATVGEIARQVNHDIKNGLAPIRNVVRHLAQVAHDQPAELPAIFTARQRTLESSIGYLETLAQNYARLSPTLASKPTEVAPVIAEVAGLSRRGAVTVTPRVAPNLPPVLADEVVLRRILENLVGNAVDSLEGKPGEVTVSAENTPGDPSLVRLAVADTGRGMTETELARAFDDFYTTKPHGTGLGLSVVRRLVADLGGTLRIETEPGVGTTVQVVLPAVGEPARRTTPAPAQ